LGFYYDEDGVKIASGGDPEDELPFKPEFEEGLKKALQDAEEGRTVKLRAIRSRHKV